MKATSSAKVDLGVLYWGADIIGSRTSEDWVKLVAEMLELMLTS